MQLRPKLVQNKTFTPTQGFRNVDERTHGVQTRAEKIMARVEHLADEVSLLGKPDEHGQVVNKGTFKAGAGFITRTLRHNAFNAMAGVAGPWAPYFDPGDRVRFESSVGPNDKGERNLDVKLSRTHSFEADYYGPGSIETQLQRFSLEEIDGKPVYTVKDGRRTERVIVNPNDTLTYQDEIMVADDKGS